VVVAAVILDPDRPIAGLDDSKKLNAARREALFDAIRENALAWSVVEVTAEEIDRLNILQVATAVPIWTAKPGRSWAAMASNRRSRRPRSWPR
jgi:ribonuclease HII